MKIINFDELNKSISIPSLCLGAFDGIHLGHQELFRKALALGGGEAGVFTFSPNPKSFFSPLKMVYPEELNYQKISEFKFRYLIKARFDQNFANQSALDFLNLLEFKVNFEHLVVGEKFRLGKGRSFAAEDLREWADRKNKKVTFLEELERDGKKISSTKIREALSSSDLNLAQELLGQNYSLEGTPVADQGLGKKFGVPTFNLKFSDSLALKKGVYFTRLYFLEEKKCVALPSISNFGVRPSMTSKDRESKDLPTLEVHSLKEILSSSGRIKVEFLKFLREERSFSKPEDLYEQIHEDIVQAKSFFSL